MSRWVALSPANVSAVQSITRPSNCISFTIIKVSKTSIKCWMVARLPWSRCSSVDRLVWCAWNWTDISVDVPRWEGIEIYTSGDGNVVSSRQNHHAFWKLSCQTSNVTGNSWWNFFLKSFSAAMSPAANCSDHRNAEQTQMPSGHSNLGSRTWQAEPKVK